MISSAQAIFSEPARARATALLKVFFTCDDMGASSALAVGGTMSSTTHWPSNPWVVMKS
jgi:hypothetical protein